MASAGDNIAMFFGTTTASKQDFVSAAFTWDPASSPPESTPTATRPEVLTSRSSSANVPTSVSSAVSISSTSSNAAPKQTNVSQQFPPSYDRPEPTKTPQGLYISLIVLSVVVVVTAVVVGWLAWRRFHQRSRRRIKNGRDGKDSDSTNSSPDPRKPSGRQSGMSGMTSPTLNSEQDWRVAVPAYSIDQFLLLGNSEKNPALANVSPGRKASSKVSTPLEHPPAPPAKQTSKFPPTVPPSSPTPIKDVRTPRRSSRQSTHIRIPSPPPLELRDFSPISPLPWGPK